MRNNKQYNNIVKLFKLFNNRPNHLAKYLYDNGFFSQKFLDSIKTSNKLTDLSDEDIAKYNSHEIPLSLLPDYFTDIESMKKYYNDLTNEFKHIKKADKLREELNKKLKKALDEEQYEDASKIRDYMIQKNIKIDLNF